MSRGLHVDWSKHLSDPKEKAEFELLIKNHTILRRLKQLLKEKEAISNVQETSQGDYDSPSWAYRQADRNGYRRCLRQMNELLNHIEE